MTRICSQNWKIEVRILRWAIRHQVLTKELAAQIFEVVEMNQGFIRFILTDAGQLTGQRKNRNMWDRSAVT